MTADVEQTMHLDNNPFQYSHLERHGYVEQPNQQIQQCEKDSEYRQVDYCGKKNRYEVENLKDNPHDDNSCSRIWFFPRDKIHHVFSVGFLANIPDVSKTIATEIKETHIGILFNLSRTSE